MKQRKIITLVMALLLLILSACSSGTAPDDDVTATLPASSAELPATEPAAAPSTESTADPLAAEPVSEDDITVQETPVSLAQRPVFLPEDPVQDEELVSLHGYLIGMTFAQTQQLWEIPQSMVDYAINRWTQESPSICIYVGNLYYEFKPGQDAAIDDFDNYTLQHIYYGETVFCTNREPLCVLRDIKLGDTIEDALKSLPGNRTPQQWATDQLYGGYGAPGSASLEYTTSLGFYELRIYGENSWIRLSFGSSGKLWIAEVYPI